MADLHVRTVKSLGRVTPVEAVIAAEDRKLRAIAIVDHDTVTGVPEAMSAGDFYGIEVIPGVELIYEDGPREIHFIGYFIDWRDQKLLEEIERLEMVKVKQIEDMVKKLQGLEMDIDYEEVLGKASRMKLVSRSNIAQVLVEKGAVKDFREAFNKYLAYGKPAYVPRAKIKLAQAIRLIRNAGGVVALAHPKFNRAAEAIPDLAKKGLRALEVYHPFHTEEETAEYEKLAKRHKLIPVGGTDSEPVKPPIGTVTVPYGVVEQLKKKIPKRRGR